MNAGTQYLDLVRAAAAGAAPPPEPPSDDAAPAGAGDAWETPVPLDAGAVAPFPVDALPAALADYVDAVVAFAEVPADLPGWIGLSAIAAAVARKTRVLVRPGYAEPLNIFMAAAMPPGERKSWVFAEATRPLVDYERELLERLGPEIAEAQSRARVREKELAHAEGMAARGGADALKWDNARRELARTIRETVIPAEPRVLMSDATPEAVAKGLADQGGRLAVFSPEGDVFALLTRYQKDSAPNFETFLKAHAGEEARYDRVHAPPVTIVEPALTVAVTVQPDVLRGLARDRTFRERGLLARFVFAVPEAEVGDRTFDGPPVPVDVSRHYAEAVTWLCRWPVQAAPLTLTPAAFVAWRAYALEVERDRAPGRQYHGLLDWSGKLPGLVARLAGLLHVVQGAMGAHITPAVEEATMGAAVRLGRYAAAHAVAAFGLMGGDPALDGARTLLTWLTRQGLATFTKREAHAAHRATFRTAASLNAPLAELVALGWIRPAIDPSRNGKPGRPSESYIVYPGLLGDAQE